MVEVDRFEDLYPRRLRHDDELASLFYNPVKMDFATENPVSMHNYVYEKETIYNLFLYHLKDSQGGYYRTSFKDRLSNNYVCLHGSTEILDLSDRRDAIRIMRDGYEQRKEAREKYLQKVKESSDAAEEIAKNLTAQDRKRKESKQEGDPSTVGKIQNNVVVKIEKGTESTESKVPDSDEIPLTESEISLTDDIPTQVVTDHSPSQSKNSIGNITVSEPKTGNKETIASFPSLHQLF